MMSESTDTLKFYNDPGSQPCRAVQMLLQKESVPHENIFVSLFKGENKINQELFRVSPVKKLPAIDDKGFCLFESSAILAYLVDKYNLPDHWYPKDAKKRAIIDEYLAWHCEGLRKNGSRLFVLMAFSSISDQSANEGNIKELKEGLKNALGLLEVYFLSGEGPFMFGSNITIADLQCICEITQFWIMGISLEDDFPAVKSWMKNCQDFLGDVFKAVHDIVYINAASGYFKREFKWD